MRTRPDAAERRRHVSLASRTRLARRLVRRYTVAGDRTPLDFRCRSRTHDPDDGLAHSDVVCKRGTRRVSWAAF